MSSANQPSEGQATDGCNELRLAVAARCDEAHLAAAAHASAGEHIRDLKRDLVAAQRKQAATEQAADAGQRRAEKARAREAYEQARQAAESDAELAEATAAWAKTIDRINRAGRLAQRAASEAGAGVRELGSALHAAEREEQTLRIRAETAEAACLDARVQLAACEERFAAPAPAETASVFQPHAATSGHAVAISEAGHGEPLVIEAILGRDRRALELAATTISEHTGLSPAEAQLQLQELADAITSRASEEGYLVFDPDHRFWSHLTFEEGRDVIGALARLGFQFEPAEGWHAGRAPAPSDLSMALAYAGLDARNMRGLPGAEELRLLPQSIGVDARAFLAAQAPDLAVDHVVRVLGRRASALELLWDEWGQVRPILLTDRHELGSLPG